MIFDPSKMTRQNTLDFKPPLPNPWFQKLFRLLLPQICRGPLKGLSVEIDSASLDKLICIQGKRCLILPNHPSEWDPCVLFDVASKLNENFFFVAAREVFDYSYGLRGWIFQKLGVYSLVRGSNDRKSFKTSIDILAKNRGRLVIFVEGEISNQNETLMPLEPGVLQIALMALNELYKENNKNLDSLPSLYVCPVGLRYVYEPKGLQTVLEKSIRELEAATALPTPETGNHYDRLKAIAWVILAGAAQQLGYTLPSENSLVQNVQGLSNCMLSKLEHVINLPSDESVPALERIRQIRNKVDKVLGQSELEETSLYTKRLYNHQKAILRNFYEDLDRIVNFIAIYDGYLKPDMEEARYVELIRRLEKEVFGNFRMLHPRKAHVTIQEPIDLKEYFQRFLSDKRTVLDHLVSEVEASIYAGIHQKHRLPTNPLPALVES
jgi:1-acyl-sn-glycerol-3-phosphate acyltransferase